MNIYQSLKNSFFLLILVFIASVINIGSIFYYLWELNSFVYFIVLFLSFLASGLYFYFIIYKKGSQVYKLDFNKRGLTILVLLLFLIAFLTLFYILYSNISYLAIYSPWNLLNPFIFYLLASLLLLSFYAVYLKSLFSNIILIFLFFSFLAISSILYGVAFGYDQLLHQRSLMEIINLGYISPKTFYYIGQYSLEFFIIKSFNLPLEIVSKFLVPVLASLFLPLFFVYTYAKKYSFNAYYLLLIFLIFPFSIFTYTVPQNLAFLLALLIIILSINLSCESKFKDYLLIAYLSLSAFFVHPLAGLSVLIFVASLFSYYSNFKYKKYFSYLLYLAQVIVLPSLLFVLGASFKMANFNYSFFIPKLLGQEQAYLNLIYFIFFNRFYLLLALVIASLIYFLRNFKKLSYLKPYIIHSALLFTSYLISLFASFSFLHDVDKASYSQRILILSFLFFVPILVSFFNHVINLIKLSDKKVRFASLAILLVFILSSVYLSYPRKDNHYNSRSYSSSLNDFTIVEFIENNKENDNFIVLANQQLGAVAVKQFGFKRYYGPWFYYSLQTGGLFYEKYLDLLSETEADIVFDLLKQVGADSAYVVVHDYWWAYERIVSELKLEADNYYELAGSHIFYFSLLDKY